MVRRPSAEFFSRRPTSCASGRLSVGLPCIFADFIRGLVRTEAVTFYLVVRRDRLDPQCQLPPVAALSDPLVPLRPDSIVGRRAARDGARASGDPPGEVVWTVALAGAGTCCRLGRRCPAHELREAHARSNGAVGEIALYTLGGSAC